MYDVESMLRHVRERAQVVGMKYAIEEMVSLVREVKRRVGQDEAQINHVYLTQEPIAKLPPK